MRTAALFFALVVGVACQPALADPGPVGQYLMRTEVSLFSFGLYQLNQDMDGLETTHPALFGASYDWDQNRIELNAWAIETVSPTQERCAELVNAIRSRGGIDVETGKLLSIITHSLYANNFAPIGYGNTDEPDDWGSRLDRIFVVRATITSSDGTSVSCQGRLVSNELLVDMRAPGSG